MVQRPVEAVPILSAETPPALGRSLTVTTNSEAPGSVADGRSRPEALMPGNRLADSSAVSSAEMVSGRVWGIDGRDIALHHGDLENTVIDALSRHEDAGQHIAVLVIARLDLFGDGDQIGEMDGLADHLLYQRAQNVLAIARAANDADILYVEGEFLHRAGDRRATGRLDGEIEFGCRACFGQRAFAPRLRRRGLLRRNAKA
jgi:hypothetical protein